MSMSEADKEYIYSAVFDTVSPKERIKRVQEWLGLNGFYTVIDGIYGPATRQALANFQAAKNLPPDGQLTKITLMELIAPLIKALTPIDPTGYFTIRDMVILCAQQHLSAHPREIGGQNKGPWVRLYMQGKEGVQWPWCAGFVSYILQQACGSLGLPTPLKYTYSCYLMARDAQEKLIFLAGKKLDTIPRKQLDGSIFLVQKGSDQWSHTGIVLRAEQDYFYTIEGNTNDSGSPEGYEVCQRTRGYQGKDFILL